MRKDPDLYDDLNKVYKGVSTVWSVYCRLFYLLLALILLFAVLGGS
jgi:hypothetical protein